jgi:uncharacterized membrane protein YphA (DoxX/SURF4 family)
VTTRATRAPAEVTVAIWLLSVLLVAEFVMAPINLWTGRTMPIFTRFTGFSPVVARRGFAPAKLVAAILIAVGLAVRLAGLAGAALTAAVCLVYLVRLAARGRRDAAGIAAFTIFGCWALALLVLQLMHGN